jgi:DNA-binding MarR family transcriptional regulator
MTAAALVVEAPARTQAMLTLVETVHRVVKASLHRVQPTLSSEGITMGQFWALHTVSGLDSASLNTVARSLGVSSPTLCASLDQLEESGLIRRTRSAKDRRAIELSLTARGRRVEARIWEEVARVMSAAGKDVAPADVASAQRVFSHLADRLKVGSASGRRSA